jgi:uncharacterized protein YjiS (DUF1127 family)
MSGSSESNEDLVAGRVNRANDQTTIWAENRFNTVSIGPFEVESFRVEFGGRFLRAVRSVFAAIRAERHARSGISELRQLDDHLLSDVGLTRRDVEFAARHGRLPTA